MPTPYDDWTIREWAEWKRDSAFANVMDTVHDVPHPQLIQEVRDLLNKLEDVSHGHRGSGFRSALNNWREYGTLNKTRLERVRIRIQEAIAEEAGRLLD